MDLFVNFWSIARPVCAPAAFTLLVFSPGAWIAFGLRLTAIPIWARLFTGAMLSPLVAAIEFFALRLAGLPFGPAVWALCAINLPALWLISRNNPKFSFFGRGTAFLALFTVTICIALLARALTVPEARLYSAHAWVYSDPAYMFAKGDLNLEDPVLAGVPMSYPVWGALAFQSAASFLLNSPPMWCWVWINLVWLMLICALIGAIARELGGGRMAQASAAICLTLGINPIGYTLTKLLPSLAGHRLFGDDRYTPWITKFYSFSTMPLGLGMIAAMLYLLVQPGRLTRPVLVMLGLLTAGTGFIYPLVFPPAVAIVAARAFADIWENRRAESPGGHIRRMLPLGAIVVVSALATFAQVKYLGRARAITTPELTLSAGSAALRKGVVAVIVCSVLLAAMAVALRKCWNAKPRATIVLLGGAVASFFLHSAFSIAYWDNEYKFIITAAMCLAPFAAVATERVWRQWRRPLALATLAVAAVLLTAPFLHRFYTHAAAPRQQAVYPGALNVSGFYLRLDASNPWSAVCTAIRTAAPPNAVLVVKNSDYYFPALTARSLYVPPDNRFYAGITLGADVLEAGVRGNGRAILAERRATVAGLFDSAERDSVLGRIRMLRRPIVVVTEQHDAALAGWLREGRHASIIYVQNNITVWLLPADNAVT